MPIDRYYLRDLFIKTSPFIFNFQEIKDSLYPLIYPKRFNNLVPVLSHEQFSGQPQGGACGIRKRQREASRKEVADRLSSCFPDAKVLIVIREQKEMICSIYKYLVCGWNGRLSASVEQFLDQQPLKNGYAPIFHTDYLKYDTVISYYQKCFGKKSVLVLPYELLHINPLMFINNIQRFSGLSHTIDIPLGKENKSKTAVECTIRRFTNRIIVSPNKPGEQLKHERIVTKYVSKTCKYIPENWFPSAELNLLRKIENAIEGVYAESNKKTEQLTKLSLTGYGYELQD